MLFESKRTLNQRNDQHSWHGFVESGFDDRNVVEITSLPPVKSFMPDFSTNNQWLKTSYFYGKIWKIIWETNNE